MTTDFMTGAREQAPGAALQPPELSPRGPGRPRLPRRLPLARGQSGSVAPRRDRAGAGNPWRGAAERWPRGTVMTAVCTALVGLLLFVLPLRHLRLSGMTGFGLISVLPISSLAGLALLVVAFVVMLARRRPHPVILAAMLLALIFCLVGVTALAEPLPRFPTAYQIAGFVDYISRTGHVAPDAAAYFSWPGFFALVAFVSGAAGAHSLLPLMTWWPVVLSALNLLPFMLITRSVGLGWRARWLAALLFCAGNWVGQDYFSPQSFSFLLYLVFVAILLTWFGRRPAGQESAGQERPPVGGAQRAVLLLLLVGIFAVATVSHQLTPFLMLATCTALVVVRRCTLRGLPVLLGVILVGWISFGTVAYWSGHLATIFGEVGHLGGNVSASVGDRVIGTPVHQLALYVRVGLPAVMAGLAITGLLRRWRRRLNSTVLLVLLCVPVTAVAMQNYGGEISLRVYLFALPAAAMLAACLFFPQTSADDQRSSADDRRSSADAAGLVGPDAAGRAVPAPGWSPPAADPRRRARRAGARPSVLALVAAAMAGVSLAGLFLVGKYGNEAFERTPPGDLAAMNYLFAHNRAGISVLWLSRPASKNATPAMPWQYRDITSVRYVAKMAPTDPARVNDVIAELRNLGQDSYLITTDTEATFLRQTGSYPADWSRRFRAAMATAPGVRVAYANSDAVVYAIRQPGTLAPGWRPLPVSSGGAVSPSAAWRTAGELAVLVLALLLLVVREVIRVCLPRWHRLLRPLALVALPAVMLLAFVVVERFVVVS